MSNPFHGLDPAHDGPMPTHEFCRRWKRAAAEFTPPKLWRPNENPRADSGQSGGQVKEQKK